MSWYPESGGSLPINTVQTCKWVFGVSPKPEQLDVVDMISRRKDCILIAATGWGKSLVFYLPLVLWPKDIIVIITPLRVLGDEQAGKLAARRIRSINIKSGMTIPVQELVNGKYQAVFMSPEMVFDSPRYSKLLWSDPGWKKRLRAIIVDEAHCVGTWGGKFRPHYSRLGELRAMALPTTCFIAVSATLPPPLLSTLITKLHFEDPRIINVGNDRINVKYKVLEMKHPARSYQDLAFLKDKVKTIVYFQTQSDADDACHYVRKLLGDNNISLPYHSNKSEESKADRMAKFKSNRALILLSTEAAGMGCDINDVVRVVQYGYPNYISTLIQRLGRAARNPGLSGVGILIIPSTSSLSTVEQEVKDYAATTGCRRKFLNNYFGNNHQDVADCCDNCHPDPAPSLEPRQEAPTDKKQARPSRTKEEKDRAKEAIIAWRETTFKRDYLSACSIAATRNCLMSENIINQLADKFAGVTTPESISTLVYWIPSKPQYLQELCQILVDLNKDIESRKRQPRLRQSQITFSRGPSLDSTDTAPRPSNFAAGELEIRSQQQLHSSQNDQQAQQSSQQQQQETKRKAADNHTPRPRKQLAFKIKTSKDFVDKCDTGK